MSSQNPVNPVNPIKGAVFLYLVLGLFWASLIYQLSAQWSVFEEYNYGYAVPFLCLYLLFLHRPKGQVHSPPAHHSTTPPLHHSIAFIVLIACSALLLPIRWVHEANPVWRLTTWAWALCLVGLTLSIVYLCRSGQMPPPSPPREERAGERSPRSQTSSELGLSGAGARGRIADVLFPICFFLVAVPWPFDAELALMKKLALRNAAATVEVLGMLGVPAIQQGNVIEVATGMVGIDEACSGIRSFQATLMIALFLGEIYSLTALRRILCVFAGFLLAFVFNVFRTTLLAYVGATKGTAAISAWHDPAGVMILIGCFSGLWAVVAWMKRSQKQVHSPEAEVHPSAVHQLSTLTPQLSAIPHSALRTPHSPLSHPSTLNYQLAAALLAWFLVVEVGVEGWYRWHEGRGEAEAQWAVHPEKLGAKAQAVAIPPTVSKMLNGDQGTHVEWQGEKGEFWQMFYFRWEPSTSSKRRAAIIFSKMHRPEVCLTGSGLKVVEDLGVVPVQFGNLRLAVRQYVFEREGERLHVFFGVYEDSSGPGKLANFERDRFQRLKAAWAGNRYYGQRSLEVAVSGPETPERARELFVRELSPLVSMETLKR